jgi:translation initiation factor IF-3
MLRGRENHYSELAYEKMNTFASLLGEVYKID